MLRGIYCVREDFLTVKPKAGVSWVWRSILHGRELLKKEGRWCVGDGNGLSVTEDNWLASGKPAVVKPGCATQEVKELIDSSSNSWNVSALRSLLTDESAIDALKTSISVLGGQNILFWPHGTSVMYSVRSGYQTLNKSYYVTQAGASGSFSYAEESWKRLWSLKVPGRVRHFLWRLMHNAITSCVNLAKRRIAVSNMCPICKNREETIEHILFLCPWTTPVWFGLQLCRVPNAMNISHFGNWLENLFDLIWEGEEIQDFSLCCIIIALWQIWKARNEMVFSDSKPNPMEVLFAIKINTRQLQSTQTDHPNLNFPTACPRSAVPHWSPPSDNYIKFNSDAQFDMSSGRGWVGVIARNSAGRVIGGNTSRIFASSPLVAESLALREALIYAANLGLRFVIFESDCLNLINNCNSLSQEGEIQVIIQDIRGLGRNFTSCIFCWVNRSGNMVADGLAKMAATGLLPSNWLSSFPSTLRRLVAADGAAM